MQMRTKYQIVHDQENNRYLLCMLHLDNNNTVIQSDILPGFAADSVEQLCVIYAHLGAALIEPPVKMESESVSTGVDAALDLLRHK